MVRYYLSTLICLLKEPGSYFQTLPETIGAKKPLGFLLVSCLISTMVALATNGPSNPVMEGGIYFINGMGMAVVTAGFGFMIMTMFMKQRVTFSRFLSIYALSTGATVLVAWIPWCVWMAEPWKWWLIGTGMTRNFGFKTRHAVSLLITSMVVMVIFFSSFMPVVVYLKTIMS